ncbi:uncharacterized protein A1O9_09493 [Exophiala aquamarina CBS 119918]|uniref:Vacuolar sorting protein Vps3844 C-terminal domain-containing protein n=1 Tax=Exophiala aquamarina CBS 119918 TaxID=1182545 RepID=A0A072P3R3_9EURO|nr:uncharacterized protein A1O9_09493 [Exophiala aquamarina CBS 119918]KEF54327.1 hypothetical protein A1O9_09493 [Exophiala aquamarina CBS 119918]
MKSLTSLLSCAALMQYAAAQGAYLFTIDRSVASSSTAMLDSDLASAIIARRRALTADRHLGAMSENALDDLNIYGGYQAPLFGESQTEEAPGKLFIRISEVDMLIGDFDQLPDIWVEKPTKDLLTDFKAIPDRQTKDGVCEYLVPPSLNAPNSKGVELIFSYPLDGEPACLRASEIPHIPIILSLHNFLPTSPSGVKTGLAGLIRILKHFSATQNVESTLLLLPSKLAKPNPKPQHHNHARAAQDAEEELLDLSSIAPIPSGSSPFITPQATGNASANFTLPRVIPECFSSQSACENTTNFCSGHGSCYSAHSKCFKCRCGTTLARVNPDGTSKTTQWGGLACQKKDISVPFILFATFGVFMAAVIAGGIGMMYSMGAEPLPSVLGAGVAGPKAGK